VAVIGWGLWQRRFGGVPDIIGRELRLSSAVRNFEGGSATKLAGAGIALGLLGALATTHAMRSMLFGVSTTDLPTFVITATVLTVAVLAACGFTAWRAISVDPVEALRRE
jgi:hypothetical protein